MKRVCGGGGGERRLTDSLTTRYSVRRPVTHGLDLSSPSHLGVSLSPFDTPYWPFIRWRRCITLILTLTLPMCTHIFASNVRLRRRRRRRRRILLCDTLPARRRRRLRDTVLPQFRPLHKVILIFFSFFTIIIISFIIIIIVAVWRWYDENAKRSRYSHRRTCECYFRKRFRIFFSPARLNPACHLILARWADE